MAVPNNLSADKGGSEETNGRVAYTTRICEVTDEIVQNVITQLQKSMQFKTAAPF